MADTLTQLIAKIQPQLLDNGTLFTVPTLTAAVRQALNDLNDLCPENQAVTIATVADQKEYEISAEDSRARKVLDVLLEGTNEYDVSLDFDQYVEDSRVFIRLRTAQGSGHFLIVRYTIPYTITGLDSATDSTLPDEFNTVIIGGACYHACLIRSAYTVEANNVNSGVSQMWLNAAAFWQNIFKATMANAKVQRSPVSEPDRRTWEDGYHNWP